MLKTFLSAAIVTTILIFLVLPTLLVIPMSLNEGSYLEFPPRGLTFEWYLAYFADPDWMEATRFSLQIAFLTAVISTVVGTMAALAIAKSSLPGRGILQSLALGPMIVPHIVLGVALYLVFAPLRMTGTIIGFVLAHTVLAVPYVVIVIGAALQKLDSSLGLAAQNCGATRMQAFFFVELPNIGPSIAAASVFAFLASFDDATVSFFISDVGGKSIGRKMFEDIDFNLTPVIAAASTVLVAVSLVLMVGVKLLTGRRAK
ncbi:ABC transporter permease [Agrobacterium sp. V1]|uniref:ABC transporter permease n=1 Tax=Agrobacterium sp. V1 TaxID=3061957 RepID=UPI0026724E75|nr:ABC transporter permease [Agrobacterium sp. V1]MDO3445479.1 ABC transporter permease [Agrobacterium sp. V1]